MRTKSLDQNKHRTVSISYHSFRPVTVESSLTAPSLLMLSVQIFYIWNLLHDILPPYRQLFPWTTCPMNICPIDIFALWTTHSWQLAPCNFSPWTFRPTGMLPHNISSHYRTKWKNVQNQNIGSTLLYYPISLFTLLYCYTNLFSLAFSEHYALVKYIYTIGCGVHHLE
jgi:hypothetical protein